jgi:hypothetical protein
MVAEHERSGLPVRTFCEQAKVNEHSFYNWRARLRTEDEPVRFALVEPLAKTNTRGHEGIELTLASGERLRIGAGADAATMRMVLAALRG